MKRASQSNYNLVNNTNNSIGKIYLAPGCKVTFNSSVTADFATKNPIEGEIEINNVTIYSSNTTIEAAEGKLRIVNSDNLGIAGYILESNYEY
ncbi:MAG: hypothetical protein EOP33_01025 [Rickettsiaceae bacterium]|nr:MAG: hypothetical protein EOP33_01025 [Rickettsiaceae bacterium]